MARDEGHYISSSFGPERIHVNSAMSPLGPAVNVLGRKKKIIGLLE